MPLDVVRVGDDPELPLAVDDPGLLAWAEEHSRLLVTEDRHTMANHLKQHLDAGRHLPGILMVRPRVHMRQIVERIVLIAYVGGPAEFADVITHIP